MPAATGAWPATGPSRSPYSRSRRHGPPQKAPASATYYLAKVFYGRSFEVRLSGDEKQFHSGLAGTFLSGKLEGGLKTFAEKNRLEFSSVGRGLRPKTGTALFAKQPSEIEENYTVEGSAAVPVEVEYRLIPGRALPALDPIVWRKQARYRVELSAVEAHGCDRTSACDLTVTVGQVGREEKPKVYRGPDDTDVWEPRYLLLETTDESELEQGFAFEIADSQPHPDQVARTLPGAGGRATAESGQRVAGPAWPLDRDVRQSAGATDGHGRGRKLRPYYEFGPADELRRAAGQ